jgi:hypothetical protein
VIFIENRLVSDPIFCGCLAKMYNLSIHATLLILPPLLAILENELPEHHGFISDDTFQLTLLFYVKVKL